MAETNEKLYLRNAFLAGSIFIAIPLVYGAIRGFPEWFYAFGVPFLGGLLIFIYALENSIRGLRARIESLERREREREREREDEPKEPPPRRPPFDPGAR
jgi:hypothetical protein